MVLLLSRSILLQPNDLLLLIELYILSFVNNYFITVDKSAVYAT